jgi:hypothetical protein
VLLQVIICRETTIEFVPEIHITTSGACSVHKNNEESLCKHGSLNASFSNYGLARSPDLNPPEFNFCSHFKSTVYATADYDVMMNTDVS